jgi:steroid 5-alpha reductase family enzyme
MMELVKLAGISALVVFIYMTVFFILALIRRDNSIADVAWGPGFVIVAGTTLLISGSFTPRQLIAAGMILIWGLRLGARIYLRNRGKGEDERYRKWRETWGKSFVIRSYFQVFMLQGGLLLLNSAPVIAINAHDTGKLGVLDFFGMLLWVSGFCLEAISDRQLDRFTADSKNRGRIMSTGLWRYSRHPNYFGEVLLWWGLYVMALSVPWGWLSAVGPLTITALILFVSGIPMTEKLMENNPEFALYKRRTSVFIPWFLKSG